MRTIAGLDAHEYTETRAEIADAADYFAREGQPDVADGAHDMLDNMAAPCVCGHPRARHEDTEDDSRCLVVDDAGALGDVFDGGHWHHPETPAYCACLKFRPAGETT